MTELNEIYKCNVCGNMVEMVHTGVGQLVCCGQPMERILATIEGFKPEKHIPILEFTDNGIKVTVGTPFHPMEDAHYIEWIEVIVDGRIERKFLKPGDNPVAEFCQAGDSIMARAYCNLHGLWKDK